MCSNCERILPHFLVKHAETSCPYMSALYCTFCATYGHSHTACARRPTTDVLPTKGTEPAAYFPAAPGPVFDLPPNDRALRAFLYSQGLSIAGKTDALQDRVKLWAAKNGYTSVTGAITKAK